MTTKPSNYPVRAVVRVDRSPTNNAVWVLELECGHDHYTTLATRPTRKTMACDKCRRLLE